MQQWAVHSACIRSDPRSIEQNVCYFPATTFATDRQGDTGRRARFPFGKNAVESYQVGIGGPGPELPSRRRRMAKIYTIVVSLFALVNGVIFDERDVYAQERGGRGVVCLAVKTYVTKKKG
jgi:hypothetical protein